MLVTRLVIAVTGKFQGGLFILSLNFSGLILVALRHGQVGWMPRLPTGRQAFLLQGRGGKPTL
jgi:hypothetical protein